MSSSYFTFSPVLDIVSSYHFPILWFWFINPWFIMSLNLFLNVYWFFIFLLIEIFFLHCWVFLMNLCEFSYIVDFNPLSVICIVNVSSQIEASIFIFFSIFWWTKVLTVIKFILSCYLCCLVSFSIILMFCLSRSFLNPAGNKFWKMYGVMLEFNFMFCSIWLASCFHTFIESLIGIALVL